MREFVNLEQIDHTKTKRMNKAVEDQLDYVDSLLKDGDAYAFNLIKDVKPVRPAFYFNRMLALHYPDDEYALSTGGDYDSVDADLRNALIISKMIENKMIKKDERTCVVLRGRKDRKTEFTNVVSVFKGSETTGGSISFKGRESKRTGEFSPAKLNRDRVLLAALAFNLTYEETVDFLKGSVGCLDLNFKDPYEVILTYCLFEYEDDLKSRNPGEEIDSVYTRYTAIREKYEKEYSEAELKDYSSINTQVVKEDFFKNVDSKEDLIEFVLRLPSDQPSVSASSVFEREARRLYTVLNCVNKEAKLAFADEQLRSGQTKPETKAKKEKDDEKDDHKFFHSADALMSSHVLMSKEKEEKGKEEKREKYVVVKDYINHDIEKEEVERMLNMLKLNPDYSTKGDTALAFKISSLEAYFSSGFDIEKFLECEDEKITSITREFLIEICFFNYIFLRKKEYFEKCERRDSSNASYLKQLYYNFKAHVDPVLRLAGFKDLYLPNYFERKVVYCLMTENPIDTFSKIMNKEI